MLATGRSCLSGVGADILIPTKKGVSITIDEFPKVLEGVKKLGDVMSNEKVVATIRKSDTQEIRIGITTFKNIPLIYIRTFAYKNDQWLHTQKGISMKVDLYPKLLESLGLLNEEIKKLK